MPRRQFVIAAAMLSLIGSGAAHAMGENRLDEHMKAMEQRLKQRPDDQVLKEWLDHAKDFKSGERTDHPGDPPH